MIEEAKIDQWKQLYEIALKIKVIEPWNYLWDTDLIAIHLKGIKEPCYCSILGRGGDCYGIHVFVGYEGLNDYLSIIQASEYNLSINYIMCEITNLSCCFGNREDVPIKQKNKIKELGYKFRGKNQWLYFESYKKGYMAYPLSKDEVDLLIQCYKNIYMAVKSFIKHNLQIRFDEGEALTRKYDKKNKKWFNLGEPLPFYHWQYPIINLQDDILKARLKKLQVINASLELDVQYLPTYVKDKNYNRPVRPKIILLMDAVAGTIISQEIIGPKDDEVNMILNLLVTFMMKNGKMAKLYYSKPQIEGIIKDFARSCRITIEKKKRLSAVETFINEIMEFI